MSKTTVAILFGGRSVEHDISVLSARNVVENLNKERFTPVLIGISRQGVWYLCDTVADPDKGQPLQVTLDANQPVFRAGDQAITPDVVFPVLHGTDGEDGSVQGLLQVLNLPCVGSGVLGSAAAMDKLLAKRVLQASKLPVAPFLIANREDTLPDWQEVSQKLGTPVIVKPANLGSSVGVNKVEDAAGFEAAIKEALQYDHTALIETFIRGREVECAILGNHKPVVSVAGEVVLSSSHEFYSFTAKYEDPQAARIVIPADMPDAIHERIRQLSLQAYRLLNCQDLARVDLFVQEDGQVFVNEVNTIPGFTDISMYPMLMQHEGIAYGDLLTRLIEMAQARHAERNKISTDYKLRV